ncbi:type II toxin-antitoxin system RatA family toxin [Aquabacterium soli]|jgi:ribosome-associated toxin RatA of RatAB toxin-antitoxin module|uniref:Type II toxin-antitoxin system RatA family toxin n=1 Tax=Aquabacterium soli TaxID=2493092 RepID=A0A3R8U2V9_9BURK|nr:type II toxin-antitoxin system RatA family toxin [Aquabacterium soli]RRS03554.1 type II toxin-antitoxin system RatA family toxin [Aquabacterium soli]
MKHVQKSVLLWYSPHEMYSLVTNVQDYPKFLPWCDRAEVLQAHDDGVTARLHIAFAGVRQAFTTRNTHVEDEQVVMKLVDGPFSKLEGVWRFIPLQAPGQPAPADGASAQPTACKVEFSLQYAFANRPLELVVSPVFDRIANTFVDAFVKRAEQVHGPR